MSTRAGRPRVTPEELQARILAYCLRYGVKPGPEGLPPFPAGQRETKQHREWIGVYKSQQRLARRHRGQCERCSAPISEGSIFCEEHRAHVSDRAADHGATPESLDDRQALLDVQAGRCPICAQKLDPRECVAHRHAAGSERAVVHASCHRMIGMAEAVGPDGLDRLRAYLWPDASPRSRRRPSTD